MKNSKKSSNISIILTAYKEADTITKALKYICDPDCSGYKENLEVIQISPDIETKNAGEKYIKSSKLSNINYHVLIDDNLGKPHALNMGLKKAQGEILILTDGDVFFEEGALGELINNFKENNLDAATGHVLSSNKEDNFMGYISHLMTEAAHHKRLIELEGRKEGFGTKIVKKTNFFPLSGYMLIFNRKKLEEKLGEGFVFPTDCLVDDAYLSYVAYNYGLKLGYIPEAKVTAKFPTNLNDYIKQKARSTGGFVQLWKYGVVKKETNSRSFWQEIRYFWFPFKFLFINNLKSSKYKQLVWTILFYPLRSWLWLKIFWERRILKKDFVKTWVRIESTKTH